MPEVTSSQPNLSCGELSPIALGRYDLTKYNNGLKKMENFLINQLGGAFFRSGTRYVADCKYPTKKARVIPFQYSTEDDYVVEMGDLYMKFFENDAGAITKTTSPCKFLSNFNGIDASFAIQDSGNTGHIVTAVSGANTSTTQYKIGSSSLSLNGSTQYLTIPMGADAAMGAGDFTISGWFYFSEANIANTITCLVDGDTNTMFQVQYQGGGQMLVYLNTQQYIFAWTPTASTWTHIAVVRSGTNLNLYINGTVTGATAISADNVASQTAVWIGAQNAVSNRFFKGYIDELRIVKGEAIVPAAGGDLTAYTATANTKLLLHMESLDIAGNKPLTFVGTAQLDTAVKKFGTASLLLDGDSDYVTTPDSADFYFGSDAFTIRSHCRFAGVGAQQNICGQYEDANNYWFCQITAANKLQIKFVIGGVTKCDYIMTSAIAGIAINTFYHFAFVRSGSSVYIFVDGVSQTLTATTAVTTNDVGNVSAVLSIGCQNAAAYFNGRIDDLVIEKGYARYTADFTAPAAEATVETITTSTIVTDYLEADLFDLHYAQSNDVMYITHPDYPPAKLSRTDATTFDIADVDFVRGPFLDSNITTTTITPSAQTGAGITLTASIAIFNALHVGSLWRLNSAATTGAVIKITAFTSTTLVTGDVQTEPDGSAGDIGGVGAYTDWAEGAFSEYRGYPATITFHEQRLYYACTTEEPQKFWGSVIRAFDNFDSGAHTGTGTPTDEDSVTFEISTEQRNNIRWMTSGAKSLILGTSGGTFSVYTGNANEPISSDNVLVSRDTNYGVADLRPSRLSSYVYYIQRDLNRMRELKYSFQVDGITSDDMTLLAEHILRDGSGAKEFTHQQSPNDRMWVVRNDGTMSVLTRNPEQDVMGWARIVAGLDSSGYGEFESVCVIPKENQDDQVWVVVKRMIDGTETRFVEFFTPENFTEDWDAVRCDSSLTLDNPLTITGVTTADPRVITIANHGLISGDQVKIHGVEGIDLDGEFLVIWISANTFSLTDLSGTAIDSSLLGTYISGGKCWKMVTNISGLDHLEGENVVAIADGYSNGTLYTVVGGGITLGAKAAVVHVGLPYEGTIQMLKLSDGSALGTGQTKTRRIFLSAIRVDRTQGLWIGRSLTTLDEIFYDDTSLFTGDIHKFFQTSWGKGDEIIIRQISPNPAHILALIMSSEVTD